MIYGKKLFLPEEYSNRYTGKIKLFSQLIFQIVLIRCFYIIREISEERKGWYNSRKLRHIFYLDCMTAYDGRMVFLNSLQHSIIQLGGRNFTRAVLINLEA